MMTRRQFFADAFIALPAVLATAVAVFGGMKILPDLEAEERTRLTLEYRNIAEELQQHAEHGAGQPLPRGERGRTRTMGPGRWGYVETTERTMTVWYSEGSRFQSIEVAKVAERPILAEMLAIISILLAITWCLTIVGCWMYHRSIRERDNFMAATIHELTTPLEALRLGFGRNHALDRQLLERLMRLVGNLRDFLRLGGRRAKITPMPIDLRRIYDEAYQLFAYDYEDEDSDHPGVQLDGPDSLMALGDETAAMQVIWNLLANDLKYAFPFGLVRARLFTEDGKAVFELIDEGKGMPRHVMNHCFDPYFRGKSALESGKGGFGIGLYTARDAARRMGGDLTVCANVPKGCVFRFTLPSA